MKVYLDKGAYLPERAHPRDAGLDLRAPDIEGTPGDKIYGILRGLIPPGESRFFDTGVHIELPPGTVGLVMTRSGMNRKNMHCEGVIDENYRGSIGVTLYNASDGVKEIRSGNKIAQLVIVNCVYEDCEEVSCIGELSESDRGQDGFGSTGK